MNPDSQELLGLLSGQPSLLSHLSCLLCGPLSLDGCRAQSWTLLCPYLLVDATQPPAEEQAQRSGPLPAPDSHSWHLGTSFSVYIRLLQLPIPSPSPNLLLLPQHTAWEWSHFWCSSIGCDFLLPPISKLSTNPVGLAYPTCFPQLSLLPACSGQHHPCVVDQRLPGCASSTMGPSCPHFPQHSSQHGPGDGPFELLLCWEPWEAPTPLDQMFPGPS